MKKTKWPETVIFWGAGATHALGFPPTAKQGELLINLSKINDSEDYRDTLAAFKYFSEDLVNEMADLLFILDDDSQEIKDEHHRMIIKVTDTQLLRAKALFSLKNEEHARNLIVTLRYNYDFSALKKITKLCTAESWSIVMSVFSLIDYHMGNSEGFFTKDEPNNFLEKHRLLGARNALIMLIVSSMTGAYLNALESRKSEIAKYKLFADNLARHMRSEAEKASVNPQNERDFYLFSYAIISLNWDHFLNWMIFHAHKDFNEDKANDSFNGRHIRLKFFNDFSVLMGLRELSKDNDGCSLTTKIWYPYNESVVQRINDPDYDFGKIIRVGKYYYPHGCLGWRVCPNCGSVTGSFGDIWDKSSESLFPPGLVPASRKITHRSEREKKWVECGQFDAFECSYCGSKTELKDTPLLMQTAVKGNVPPVLRIIQSDINACLEKVNHIVFLGYSLPPDDLVWRSILLARKGEVKCSVVLGIDGPPCWQTGNKACDIKGGRQQEIERFFEVFGYKKLRFYTGGIPDVFEKISVAELLNYE